jgi:hypothetical protein
MTSAQDLAGSTRISDVAILAATVPVPALAALQ